MTYNLDFIHDVSEKMTLSIHLKLFFKIPVEATRLKNMIKYIVILPALLIVCDVLAKDGFSNVFFSTSLNIHRDVYPTSLPHKVNVHENRVTYIVARKGDTYVIISQEFKMGLWQLYRYNDFDQRKDFLSEGDIVYLQPKRKRARIKDAFLVSKPLTLNQIAQIEAISVKSLLKLNKDITSEFQLLKSGSKVTLR